MLPSLIINLFALFGKGLVWLAYRRAGMDACRTLDKDLNPVSSLFGIGLLIWIPCVMMTVFSLTEEVPFSIGATLYTLGYLLVYFIWFACVKHELPEMIAKATAYRNEKSERESIIKKGTHEKAAAPILPTGTATKVPGWQCECGRVNADYVMTCACGVTKKEMKLRKHKEGVTE